MNLYAVHYGTIVEIDAAKISPMVHGLVLAHGRLFVIDETIFYSRADAERKLRTTRMTADGKGHIRTKPPGRQHRRP